MKRQSSAPDGRSLGPQSSLNSLPLAVLHEIWLLLAPDGRYNAPRHALRCSCKILSLLLAPFISSMQVSLPNTQRFAKSSIFHSMGMGRLKDITIKGTPAPPEALPEEPKYRPRTKQLIGAAPKEGGPSQVYMHQFLVFARPFLDAVTTIRLCNLQTVVVEQDVCALLCAAPRLHTLSLEACHVSGGALGCLALSSTLQRLTVDAPYLLEPGIKAHLDWLHTTFPYAFYHAGSADAERMEYDYYYWQLPTHEVLEPLAGATTLLHLNLKGLRRAYELSPVLRPLGHLSLLRSLRIQHDLPEEDVFEHSGSPVPPAELSGFSQLHALQHLTQLHFKTYVWNVEAPPAATPAGVAALCAMTGLVDLCIEGFDVEPDATADLLSALPNLHRLQVCVHGPPAPRRGRVDPWATDMPEDGGLLGGGGLKELRCDRLPRGVEELLRGVTRLECTCEDNEEEEGEEEGEEGGEGEGEEEEGEGGEGEEGEEGEEDEEGEEGGEDEEGEQDGADEGQA